MSYINHYYPDPTEGVKYRQITNADTYMNVAGRTFYFGGGTPPSGTVDFWGVATHELGHWVFLVDNYTASCTHVQATQDTMCGNLDSTNLANETLWIRTLTADDVTSANHVYP